MAITRRVIRRTTRRPTRRPTQLPRKGGAPAPTVVLAQPTNLQVTEV